ncbi:MAG: NYN domain-containing protein [Elusimicrobiota bacterium]
MSLHYLIDGYNFLHKYSEKFPGNLRKSREKFIKKIKKTRPEGSSRNKITVVFDGQPGINFPSEKGLNVIFTSGREADDIICDIVEESSNPKRIKVITEDNFLKRRVKEKGARIMKLQKFYVRIFPQKRERKYTDTGEPDPKTKEKINRDLFKEWIDKKQE